MARIKLELPEKFIFSTKIPIRISDINYGNHLGNDAVLTLIHEARLQLFQEKGLSEVDIDGTGLLISDVVIIYKSQGFYGDVLTIEVTPDDINRSGCDFLYKLTSSNTGREIARAKTGIVFFNYSTKKVARVPERFKKTFFPD